MGKLKWVTKSVSFSCQDPPNFTKGSALRQLFLLPCSLTLFGAIEENIAPAAGSSTRNNITINNNSILVLLLIIVVILIIVIIITIIVVVVVVVVLLLLLLLLIIILLLLLLLLIIIIIILIISYHCGWLLHAVQERLGAQQLLASLRGADMI